MVSEAGRIRLDLDGIHFDAPFTGSADVHFGDHRGWSFAAEAPGQTLVAWPKRLRRFLDGHARVRIVQDGRTLYDDAVRFTDADREVVLRDKHGIPVTVDKWGLLQRTFEDRAGDLRGIMADESARILDVLREQCDVPAWISFGTLLGAARDGKAIGHDSDVDLCYLSRQPTPAESQRELWRIARVLRSNGMRVQMRTGSFLTVMIETPDGAGLGIDVYTTFFFDGLFYETATVRAPVPESAVLPLGTLPFEGRQLAAPADPAAILAASYGPGWRVPDPSFQHQPGPEIEKRFDGWFGKFWRQRREWSNANQQQSETPGEPSAFAGWVAGLVPADHRVVEIGCAAGVDAASWADGGFEVVAFDFAHAPKRRWPEREGLTRGGLNLYDARDTFTRAAMLAHHPGPQAVVARGLLESVAPDGRARFWELVPVALRRGGLLCLESESWSGPSIGARRNDAAPRVWPASPHDAIDAIRAAGGTVTESEGIAEAEAVHGSRAVVAPVPWRLVASWPAPAAAAATDRSEIAE
ncbi:hypothetical protein ACFQ0K_03220 [Nocardioides caeni]|uniref:Uncharacterized protein n=1 Tax=Nocardioides caeni TaxID=574700 RepID=A0A4S8NMJ0_9ACTN|nr:hypothetical protein [Nocardioides caeni]THV18180.1 hypothetical protein E9934_00575 [Nocardioides caeni]